MRFGAGCLLDLDARSSQLEELSSLVSVSCAQVTVSVFAMYLNQRMTRHFSICLFVHGYRSR